MAEGRRDSGLRLWTPQEDLSVERYDRLSGNGDAMWSRHISELASILGQEKESERKVAVKTRHAALQEDSEGDCDDDECGSPLLDGGAGTPSPRSPDSPHQAQRRPTEKSVTLPPKRASIVRPRPAPLSDKQMSTSPDVKEKQETPKTPSRVSIEARKGKAGQTPWHSGVLQTPGNMHRDLVKASLELVPLVREAPRSITIAGNQVTWPAISPPVKPPSLARPWETQRPSEGGSENRSAGEGEGSATPPPGSPGRSLKGATKKERIRKKVQTMGKFGALYKEAQKDRKDKEAKYKRVRQEALHRTIAVDPLPQDVCGHELATTWVSPVMQRQANEDDNLSVLRKTRAEYRQCKMQVLASFQNMPLLRPTSKEDGTGGGNSSRILLRAATAPKISSRGGPVPDEPMLSQAPASELLRAASRGSGLNAPRSMDDPSASQGSTLRGGGRGAKNMPRSMKSASWGPLGGMMDASMMQEPTERVVVNTGKFKSAGTHEGNALSQMRQAVLTNPTANVGSWRPGEEPRAVGGSREILLAGQTRAHPLQSLVLEPPSSLSHRVVVNRLESQGDAFRTTTFAEYLKENDVFTGDPKVRFDEERLRREEAATLGRTDELIGGAPKRQLRLRR